jgi:hypothetical protein
MECIFAMSGRFDRRLGVVLIAFGAFGIQGVAVASAPDEAEFLVGTFFSPLGSSGPRSRTFDYTALLLREAWPLCLAGRAYADWSWVGEVFASEVTSGFGHALAGSSLLARRYFRDPADAWRPYLQAGLGACYTDAYRNPGQVQFGEALEFKITASAGFHLRLSRSWFWAGELSFNHLSDAGLSGRNYGVHALGVASGLARSF